MLPSTRVCLDCRARLDTDAPCPRHPRAAAADISTGAGRERLRSRVWGTLDVRTRAREAAKAGTFGGGLGGLEGCVDCSGMVGGGIGDILVAIVAVAVSFFLVYLVVAWIVGMIRAYRHRLRPEGALPGPVGALASGLSGRVVSAEGELSAPLSHRPCVAFGVRLERKNKCLGGPIFLRDGETTTIEIELEDGRRVHVSAGRCRVVGPSGRHPSASVGFYLSGAGLAGDPDLDAGHYPLFPADDAKECLVREGDRVTLHAALAPLDGNYRQVTHFTTEGAVELRVSETEA